MRLTEARLRTLRHGANDPNGVIKAPYLTGFERVSWLRSADALCEAGLITANAHGDWYITDAGRAALAQEGK